MNSTLPEDELKDGADPDLAAANALLRSQVAVLNRKVASLAGEVARYKAASAASDARLQNIKETLSFRLGYLLLHAFKSPRHFFSLPGELLRLRRDAVLRKHGKSALCRTRHPAQLASLAGDTAPLYLGSTLGAPVEGQPCSPTLLARVPHNLKELRVACILDAFSYECFRHECTLILLTPQNWQQELEEQRPDFVLVESAWDGNNGAWNRKVAPVSAELLSLLAWCRKKFVPTAFWNKEDPVHFETFVGLARHFDAVFTTDVACIPQYRERLGHHNVHLLPFAAQPAIHNPLEICERKNAFCFAGSYYARFPERQQDLATFVTTLSELGRVEIFNRNSHPGNPDYSFPAEYEPFIVGSLPAKDIQIAYKGYTFGLNMNSIKQSPTMFARRVFELMASNTIVLSNASRGVKLLFGDLVIATDGTDELKKQVSHLLAQPESLRRLREAALRKVLMEHTYAARMHTIVEKLAHQTVATPQRKVLVTAKAETEHELTTLVTMLAAQTYSECCFVVLCPEQLKINATLLAKMRLVTMEELGACTLAELMPDADFVVAIAASDFYGPHYVHDFVLAKSYIQNGIIGKAAYFEQAHSGVLALQEAAAAHHPANQLPARAAFVPMAVVASQSASEWCQNAATAVFTQECGVPLTSIGEFEYCRNAHMGTRPFAEAMQVCCARGLHTGVKLADTCAWLSALPRKENAPFPDSLGLPVRKIQTIFPVQERDNLRIEHTQAGIRIVANQATDVHAYLTGTRDVELCPGQTLRDFHFVISGGLDVSMTLFFIGPQGEKLGHVMANPGMLTKVEHPQHTCRIRFALRVKGSGSTVLTLMECNCKGLMVLPVCGASPYLLLTNRYPTYTDLYKNAFVHRRVVAYKKAGIAPDVFRFWPEAQPGFYEFDGVAVTSGGSSELELLLATHSYKSVLVHFLEPAMWEHLKQLPSSTEILVWCHGSEIQHWKRRACNYATPEEQQKAESLWRKRSAFWREIFKEERKNVKFIFVSRTLANEVMEDLGITLTPDCFRVIPNLVDTTLFRFSQKSPEMRTRILTLRPFTAPNYAGDLAVKTILELSKKPFFTDLKFSIVGDGPLFEETVAPLRGFQNVELRKEFVSQSEVATLHRDHGVFLCPTRADTQGVSRDEAMASGLVPITNAVGAVPEFVDESCGFLADGEDYIGMANAIERLYFNPLDFQRISRAAAARVHTTLCAPATTAQELKIFDLTDGGNCDNKL